MRASRVVQPDPHLTAARGDSLLASYRLRRLLAGPLIAIALMAVALTGGVLTPAAADTAPAMKRAVVLVSGTAATTPFTTPVQACTTGYSAGNTWAYLRDYLVQRGYQVFTAPASVGGVTVTDTKDAYAGPFGGCPTQLPASMTINAIGSVDQSGANLARFIKYLNTAYGITNVDVVGHSLGGLIGRAGIRELRLNDVPVTVMSYTTIGSPWDGTAVANLDPRTPTKGCDGEKACEGFVRSLLKIPGIQVITATLDSKNEPVWNQGQVGVLDGVPVTLVAGTYFTKRGKNPTRWPNDGVIERNSALAVRTPAADIPHRKCVAFALTHSISVSKVLGISEIRALTWNPQVGSTLVQAIDGASTALGTPDRVGCPKVS